MVLLMSSSWMTVGRRFFFDFLDGISSRRRRYCCLIGLLRWRPRSLSRELGLMSRTPCSTVSWVSGFTSVWWWWNCDELWFLWLLHAERVRVQLIWTSFLASFYTRLHRSTASRWILLDDSRVKVACWVIFVCAWFLLEINNYLACFCSFECSLNIFKTKVARKVRPKKKMILN